MGRLVGIARRERKRGAMQILEQAEINDRTGVANDSRGRPGPRQVTVISADAWREVCHELGVELPWTTRRANLLVEDLVLPRIVGATIDVGTVQLRVTMETAPCSRMEEQCNGLKRALQPDWRGGVCCAVVRGGAVMVGDPVTCSVAL